MNVLIYALTILSAIGIIYGLVMISCSLIDFAEKRRVKHLRRLIEDFTAYVNTIAPNEIEQKWIETYLLYYDVKGEFNKK